jgi:hypothetical protein
MPADRQNSGYRAIATKAAALAISVAAFVLPASSASAQGIFDSLFGRRPAPSASAYADPSPSNPFNLFGSRPEAQRPAEMSVGAVAFCVRASDGRFFPVQQHAGFDPSAGLQLVLPRRPGQNL